MDIYYAYLTYIMHTCNLNTHIIYMCVYVTYVDYTLVREHKRKIKQGKGELLEGRKVKVEF